MPKNAEPIIRLVLVRPSRAREGAEWVPVGLRGMSIVLALMVPRIWFGRVIEIVAAVAHYAFCSILDDDRGCKKLKPVIATTLFRKAGGRQESVRRCRDDQVRCSGFAA